MKMSILDRIAVAIFWWLALLFLAAFWWTAGAVVWHALAHAHDWFDYACCEEEDCRPIDAAELQSYPGGIQWTSARSGRVWKFPYSAVNPIDKQPVIRLSPDGKLYGCEQLERTEFKNGFKLVTPAVGRCLYLGGGS